MYYLFLRGTSFKVAIAQDSPTNILQEQIFATEENPQTTLQNVVNYLKSVAPFDALGIASFGPVDLNKVTTCQDCVIFAKGLCYIWIHYNNTQTWISNV